MKKYLLAALVLAYASKTEAQVSGLGVSPLGATPDDSITFYLDPSQVCATAGNTPLGANPPSVRIHSGVNGWQHVVEAGPLNPASGTPGQPYAVVGFRQIGNSLWKKTIKPSAYYGVAGSTITGINFVLNGGPDDGNRWETEGKFVNPGDGSCNDFYLPFPISATDFGFTGVRTRSDASFVLHTAYPNPFNGQTSLRFQLKKADQVTVRIVNLLGETVRILASGYMPQGEKSFIWEAAEAPAGIYFYRVEGSESVVSSKMQVIR